MKVSQAIKAMVELANRALRRLEAEVFGDDRRAHLVGTRVSGGSLDRRQDDDLGGLTGDSSKRRLRRSQWLRRQAPGRSTAAGAITYVVRPTVAPAPLEKRGGIAGNPFVSPRFRALVPEMEREISGGWKWL